MNDEEKEKAKKRLMRFGKPKTPSKQEYGLLSRGDDTRLRDNEQERTEFYSRILHEFVEFCSNTPPNSLKESLAKLVNDDECKEVDKEGVKNKDITMDSILLSLRKLREALLRNQPSKLHKKVFMFAIRISSVIGHYQSYIPSIKYLQRHRKELELSDQEFEEITIILILHLVHVNENISEAVRLFFKYIPQRKEILNILHSWIHKNYYQWIQIYNQQRNDYILAMMRLGYDKMIRYLIQGVTCSYFAMSKSNLEEGLLPDDLKFEVFVSKYHVNWKLDTNSQMVTIRERKKKTT
ncbi:hypothetical protein SBY92_002127 [Candida maltosa Xu316]